MSKDLHINTRELFDLLDRMSGRAEMLTQEVLEKAAIETEGQAAELAPVLNGDLQNSIHWESSKGKSEGRRLKTRPQEGQYLVGSSLPYAAQQEFNNKNSSGFLRKGFAHGMRALNQELIKLSIDD